MLHSTSTSSFASFPAAEVCFCNAVYTSLCFMYTYRVQQTLDDGVKTEKAVSALCGTCAQKMNKRHTCTHNEEERSMTSVWTLAEVGYALTLGYKVRSLFPNDTFSLSLTFLFFQLMAKYECYAYVQLEKPFKSFLESLTRFKVK